MSAASDAAGPQAAGHYDAVVIGSGFGGSVMTLRLAAAGRRVLLLERGRRYPPGSFPRTYPAPVAASAVTIASAEPGRRARSSRATAPGSTVAT